MSVCLSVCQPSNSSCFLVLWTTTCPDMKVVLYLIFYYSKCFTAVMVISCTLVAWFLGFFVLHYILWKVGGRPIFPTKNMKMLIRVSSCSLWWFNAFLQGSRFVHTLVGSLTGCYQLGQLNPGLLWGWYSSPSPSHNLSWDRLWCLYLFNLLNPVN